MMDPKTLVKDLDHLVSLPDICIRVNQLMGSGNYSSTQVADIISQDADISARLLRVVNSSFYGLPTKIETLSRAITSSVPTSYGILSWRPPPCAPSPAFPSSWLT